MKARTILLGLLFMTVIFACEKEELEPFNGNSNVTEHDIIIKDSLKVIDYPAPL